MSAPRIFDREHYDRLNVSRGALVSSLLMELKEPLGLKSAIDVGCGLGHFSGLLRGLGFDVTAVDGRAENAEEAARRHPGINFHTCNAEDPQLRKLGKFDLVFCFGLLYHLENPLLVIRHLQAMTGRLLLLDAVVFPGDEPIMALVDEAPLEDQGLAHFAFYPTQACLEKMLYRAGFPFAYRLAEMPDHPEYYSGRHTRKIRTMLAASAAPISSTRLLPVAEPSISIQPWNPAILPPSSALGKIRRFAAKPLPQKVAYLKKLVTFENNLKHD